MKQIIFRQPPGKLIIEEIRARGWTCDDLSNMTGYTPSFLKSLITGKTSITKEIAKSLGNAFDVSPTLFINLQDSYDSAPKKGK